MSSDTALQHSDVPPNDVFVRISARASRSLVLPLAVIIVFNLAFHSAVLQGYFQEDDWHNIKPRSATEVLKTFAGEFSGGLHGAGGFYRPLVRVAFALDRALYGLHARGYHVTNLLLHSAAAVLLFLLVTKLSAKPALALLAALLFSLYPLHPEAVFWLSGRADVMAAMFVLLALVLFLGFLDSKRWQFLFLSTASFTAGLLSKETAIVLPLFILLLIVLRRTSGEERCVRKCVEMELPFIAVVVVYLVVRAWALGGLGGYPASGGPSGALAVGIKQVTQCYDAFISLMVNPFSAVASRGVGIFASLRAAASGTLGLLSFSVIAFLALAIFNFPPLLIFGLGWMYLAPLTMLTVSPYALEGGRFLYLPVIGYSIFLAGIVAELYERAARLRLEKAIALLALALVLAYGAFLHEHNQQWVTASQTVRSLSRQIARHVRHFGLDKSYVLPNLPTKCGSAYIFRGESIVSALPVLLDGSIVAAHHTFRPEDGENSIVLLVDPSRGDGISASLRPGHVGADMRISPYRIGQKESLIWEGEQLLAWDASAGMTPLRIESVKHDLRQASADELSGPHAVTEIVATEFRGIESPHLNITKRWVTLEIRQLITNGGYGVVLWQGAAEPYGKRSATIFNDFQNRQMTHLVSLGHVSDLEHILIRPTNDVSRVLIPHIAVYTFQLVSASTP